MRLSSIIISSLIATAVSTAAHASLLVSGVVGGAPIGVVTENFDTLIPGNITTTALPSGITISYQPDAKPVSGSNSLYAAPFLSGGNGLGFGPGGSSQADGADLTTYITTGSTGAFSAASVTLQLPSLERYFGILWGSVDNYNTLSFYNGATLLGTVTGSAVTSSPDGDQGVDGTLYVNINATAGSAFDRVVATSSQYAFEFDNVAFSKKPVPEPVSLGLLGTGVLGLLLVKRRRATFSG
jgi:PEP-CTERM motif